MHKRPAAEEQRLLQVMAVHVQNHLVCHGTSSNQRRQQATRAHQCTGTAPLWSAVSQLDCPRNKQGQQQQKATSSNESPPVYRYCAALVSRSCTSRTTRRLTCMGAQGDPAERCEPDLHCRRCAAQGSCAGHSACMNKAPHLGSPRFLERALPHSSASLPESIPVQNTASSNWQNQRRTCGRPASLSERCQLSNSWSVNPVLDTCK